METETFTWPNTYAFDSYISVQIKVILDNQPLHVGEGRLPKRLRTEKGLYPLDTFNDNFCVFRCLAVHRGAHKKNNLRITRRLGHNIFSQYMKFQMHQSPCTKEHFIQGVNTKKPPVIGQKARQSGIESTSVINCVGREVSS